MATPDTRFDWQPEGDRVRLRMFQRRLLRSPAAVPYADWQTHATPHQLTALAPILAALADSELDETELVRQDGPDLSIAGLVIARLNEAHAAALHGPPATRLHLDLRSNGILSDLDFRIRVRWVDPSGTPATVRRHGAMLLSGSRFARIPEPLFHTVEAVDAFNARAGDNTDDVPGEPGRFGALAALEPVLPEAAFAGLRRDGYLQSLRIAHATAFSLRLPARGGAFDFDPVLFGREVSEGRDAEGNGDPVYEVESLMPPALDRIFQQRFRDFSEAHACYPLGDNRYCYIDPALRPALAEVRRVQKTDSKTRQSFAASPRCWLKETLGDTDPFFDRLFIETEEYSARVVGLAPWQATVLPWVKRDPETWLPEDLGQANSGLKIDDQFVPVPPEDVAPLREAVRSAQAERQPAVPYKGTEIPATEATLGQLDALEALARGRVAPGEPPDPDQQAEIEKTFVVVAENFEERRFSRHGLKQPRNVGPWADPVCLKTRLKPHQVDGVRWLWRGWQAGLPGVLLADDMGLGKTLQVIAFLAALEELLAAAPKKPVLIVAPTGLLRNWQEEFTKHTNEPFGRDVAALFACGLKQYRTRGTKGPDITAGASLLETDNIAGHPLVLTTYETLRDYHLSLARISFSVAIYDETQKLKNPSSQLARAAKAVNADFSIGMTGTPVENSLHDLWALFDVLWPGHLLDSRSFVQEFPETDAAKLHELYRQLTDPPGGEPPVMLRRMKSDHLEGLPEKQTHPLCKDMPAVQGAAYRHVVDTARRGEAGAMLETLHRLRAVSLHPVRPPDPEAHDYIAQSARLSTAIEQLDQIQARGEKALIFLEDLEMQALLATLVQARYGLSHLPLRIHGGVTGPKRQKAVNDFQNGGPGFDVMILSPKAGGVGLTLTAANHVIHLSRWWNPAVEDQCTDRIYRIGQEKTAHVYLPLAVHPDPDLETFSFDLKLHALLERKRAMSRDFLAPPAGSHDDLETLYSDVLGGAGSADAADVADVVDGILVDIDAMEPEQFEQWVIDRATKNGLVAHRTPRTWDHSADAIIRLSDGTLALCQCKHTQGTLALGDAVVADLLRARKAYAVDGAAPLLVAVTNAARCTDQARVLLQEHAIVLVARDGLLLWPTQLRNH